MHCYVFDLFAMGISCLGPVCFGAEAVRRNCLKVQTFLELLFFHPAKSILEGHHSHFN